jgi:putative membrane protein
MLRAMTDEPRAHEAETKDALRRTHLANERTYLAWWRTSLTAFAVALGAGKIVPDLTDSPRWPYALDGAGFAVLGIVLLAYGLHRQRAVEQAVARGEFAPATTRFLLFVTGFGLALGVLTFVLVAVSP